MIDGAAKLVKEYGILHPVYTVYLLGYFAAMIVTIIHSARAKKMGDTKFAGFIAGIVCSNVIVWLFEKFVSWDYEFLSLTYIASEIMLLLVYWMMQDYVRKADLAHEREALGASLSTIPMEEKIGRVLRSLSNGEHLVQREREILELILDNRKRKDIAEKLCLSENTVKTYTRTLYSKLGVSNREQLYALLLENKS
jgi:DNA-binding CsgD family transcriptional regulator